MIYAVLLALVLIGGGTSVALDIPWYPTLLATALLVAVLGYIQTRNPWCVQAAALTVFMAGTGFLMGTMAPDGIDPVMAAQFGRVLPTFSAVLTTGLGAWVVVTATRSPTN